MHLLLLAVVMVHLGHRAVVQMKVSNQRWPLTGGVVSVACTASMKALES